MSKQALLLAVALAAGLACAGAHAEGPGGTPAGGRAAPPAHLVTPRTLGHEAGHARAKDQGSAKGEARERADQAPPRHKRVYKTYASAAKRGD